MAFSSHSAEPFATIRRALLRIVIAAAVCVFPAGALSANQETKEAVERAAEKVAEEAAEKAVEKAAEKAAEKVAEDAAAKAELKAKRPDEWKGPTTVHFLVFVLDIDDIDDAAQSFAANVYIRLRWQDNRLADAEGRIRQISLQEVWNPRVVLANRQGLVSKSLPDVVQVHPDGTVLYHQRYTGKMSQPLRLSDFPRDTHVFTIQFVAAGYTADELNFVPDASRNDEITGGSIADELSLPDWRLLKYEALTFPYRPIEEIRQAGFAFRFEAQRYVVYYIWQVVLPLGVVVVMSCAAFWVERVHVGVRIGVATSSILTLIAHRFVLASLLPRLPYMTRMDYFTVGSTVLVFLALAAVVLTSFLAAESRHEAKARRIDIAARVTFPTAFLLLSGWFVFG